MGCGRQLGENQVRLRLAPAQADQVGSSTQPSSVELQFPRKGLLLPLLLSFPFSTLGTDGTDGTDGIDVKTYYNLTETTSHNRFLPTAQSRNALR